MKIPVSTTVLLFLATFATAKTIKPKNYRLPTHVTPTNYKLELTIDPESDTYHGFVEITVTANNETDTLHLHASSQYLNITRDTILLDNETDCNFTVIADDTEIIIITCEDYLDGKHTLTMEFDGRFSTDDMYGIYKSTYKEDGEQKVLVATQFEPTFARRMFPCFDEPGFKATFHVFVNHPDDYTVLGNTKIVQQNAKGSKQLQTEFKVTPKMSTYLLALVVSKFEAKTNKAKTNYDYKVYARSSAKNYMNIATTYGSQLIDIMSNFTGFAYEKLGIDQAYQVAIPDFAAGAMENWGLITYREVDLLDEGNKTSALAKQRIVTTIAHELAHQWFGDYVTLDWWSDTWLNEGFATYFEYHNPDLLEDGFETSSQFLIEVLQDVFQNDALSSSLALSSPENEVNTLAEDNNKFDDISYSKGASIVRMIKGIVGEERFQKGLQSYLSKNQYKNTNPSILLEAIQATNKSADYDVTKIMENWIYKAGFPLVTAKLNDSGTVILSQERFTTVETEQSENTEWYIPISYTTSDEIDFSIRTKHLMKPNATTEIEINRGSWIILNVQQTGFYRVNYDDTLWDRIILALKDEKARKNIHPLNRAQLVDDVFNIARVGKIDYQKVFELASYLRSETDYYPWASALNAIDYLDGKLGDDNAQSLLNTVTLEWLTSAFKNTTTPSKHIEYVRDVLISGWACKLGQEECIKYALNTFSRYKNTNSLPDYNKRGIVFCYALRNSSDPKKDYEFLFNVFKKSASPVEQNVILSSLGCISDATILSTYLQETISTTSSIRKQDAATVFHAVYSKSRIGLDVAIKFLEDNLPKIANRYKGMSSLSGIVTGLAEKITRDEDAIRLKKIISDNNDTEEIRISAQQAVDTLTANKIWTETYGSKVNNVLVSLTRGAGNKIKPTILVSLLLSSCFLFVLL